MHSEQIMSKKSTYVCTVDKHQNSDNHTDVPVLYCTVPYLFMVVPYQYRTNVRTSSCSSDINVRYGTLDTYFMILETVRNWYYSVLRSIVRIELTSSQKNQSLKKIHNMLNVPVLT